jgi:uncharacterized damage-inducible protein DinB
MNANAFRHFYNYHFSENRKIWDSYVMPLSPEQFTQDAAYSHGSVLAQLLRLLNDLGVKTVSQDYIFYVYDNLMDASEGVNDGEI